MWCDFKRFLRPTGFGVIDLEMLLLDAPSRMALLGGREREFGPKATDAVLHREYLGFLPAAWLLGVQCLRTPSGSWTREELMRLDYGGMSAHLSVSRKMGSLRFDEGLGRYVYDPSAPREGPPPNPPYQHVPFHSWRGPIPELPPGLLVKL